MDVKIKTLPPMRVACVRHTGPYNECDPAWKTLYAEAGRQGWMGPETKCLGLCHDDPETTPADQIRYDACITVGSDVDASGEVSVMDLPGGEYASLLHRGPFDKIAETYTEFYEKWLPGSGREAEAAAHIEFYHKDPNTTPPEELETEICVPLK